MNKKGITSVILKNVLIIFLFLCLSLISVCLLYNTHVLYGAFDLQFNMKRIAELKTIMVNGHPLNSIFSFNFFHGSALMGMYPYFSLIPATLILFLVHSYVYTYYLYFAFLIFVSLCNCYFGSLTFSKSKNVSFLFSIFYSTSLVFIYEAFTAGDLGITSAMVFIPLCIFGFLDILRGYNHFIKLSVGITLLLFSQISAFLIIITFLVIWFLININKINMNIFNNFIKVIILSIILTSFVWVKVLFIFLNNDINTVTPVRLTGFSLKSLITNLGILPLCALILSIIFFRCSRRYEKQMIILSLLDFIFTSKIFPWKIVSSNNIFKFLNQFQFTSRFFIIPEVLLNYLLAVFICLILKKYGKFNIIKMFILGMVILFQLIGQYYVIYRGQTNNFVYLNNYSKVRSINKVSNEMKYVVDNNNIHYLINGYFNFHDYYPKSSSAFNDYINDNLGYLDGDKKDIVHISRNGYNRYRFYIKRNSYNITLPLLMYKKENLIVKINNRRVKFYVNKNSMLVIIDVDKGYNELTIKPTV